MGAERICSEASTKMNEVEADEAEEIDPARRARGDAEVEADGAGRQV